jgi:hypothetical protein
LRSDISCNAVSILLILPVFDGRRMKTRRLRRVQPPSKVYRTDCDFRHLGSLPID